MTDSKKSEKPDRCTALIVHELRCLKVDIAALQEMHLPDEGQLTEEGGDYTLFWKSRPSSGRMIHGVGLNEQLMILQPHLRNYQKATLIFAYAPTLLAD